MDREFVIIDMSKCRTPTMNMLWEDIDEIVFFLGGVLRIFRPNCTFERYFYFVFFGIRIHIFDIA